jgi:hypothetical protein
MQVRRHCENVPGAWPIRTEVRIDTSPEKTAEEKIAELKAIADKFTAVNEEKPRRRVRSI